MRRAVVMLVAAMALAAPSAEAVVVATAPTLRLAPKANVISDGTGPIDNDADLAAAMALEAKIPDFTFGGLITPLHYTAWPHLDPEARPIRFDGEADSGNYTGNYLAAQAWRYTQAKVELAALGVDPLDRGNGGPPAVKFWRAQRDEAFARGREMVEYYDILVNIAANWQTELDPQVPSGDPEEVGWLDFGGGIIPGEAGLLLRACTPAEPTDPVNDVRINYEGHYRLIGPLEYRGSQWYCLGGTSRDSYAGTLFGLGVAFDHFGVDEAPELRESTGQQLMAMADYAIKYLWNQPRPHGMIANPVFDGNDLDGPISPLFIQVPIARLHLLQNARHVANVLGDPRATQYEALWVEEVANTVATGSLLASMLVDAAGPHSAYYKYHLHLMSFYNVIRLEPDPLIRQELMRSMAVLDATLTDDGNGFFEAITYSLTGEPERLEEAAGLQREFLDYLVFHQETARRGVTPFLHTPRCELTADPGPGAPIEQQPLDCVPKDQVDMIVTLPVLGDQVVPFQPGTDTALRARHPLPVGVRRLADFLWQKDPTIIGGDHDTPWEGPSIDYLVTYWMLRFHSEVQMPAGVTPLPAWPGPRYF